MKYSEKEIEEAMKTYHERADDIRRVLVNLELNNNGIQIIAHTGNDFLIIDQIVQEYQGKVLCSEVENELAVPAELLLNKNPDMPRDEAYKAFVDIALKGSRLPFLMVAYDDKTLECAVKRATIEQQFPKAKLLRTETNIPFYLTREVDVNSLFKLRMSIG